MICIPSAHSSSAASVAAGASSEAGSEAGASSSSSSSSLGLIRAHSFSRWIAKSRDLYPPLCFLATYVVVSCAVVVDDGVPPELVDSPGACERVRSRWALTDENVGVVELVVLGDPSADEAPGGLHGRVGAEAADLLGPAAELGLRPQVAGRQLRGERRVRLLNEVRDQVRHIESS